MSPVFSIVVPVYHEESSIASLVHHVEKLSASSDAELIVVDGAKGTTLPYIPPTTLRIRGLTTAPGRGHQIRAGCLAAEGDFVVVLHVDTLLPKSALPAVRDALSTYRAGAFDLAIRSSNPAIRTIGVVGRLRSRLTRIPYGDQAQFFRREVIERLGGFPDIPIMEDVAVMDELKRRGIPVRILRLKARTSDRRWRREGTLRATLRNWLILGAYRLGTPPQAIVRWYRA